MEPCPFCQSVSLTISANAGEWKSHVTCYSCGAKGPEASDEIVKAQGFDIAAVREWNIYARARRALGGSNAE